MSPDNQLVQNCQNKGSIIFHSKINGIFDSVKLNIVRIIIIRAVYGIVETQRPLLIFGIAENKFEDSVFVMIIYAHLKKSPRLILNLTIFRFILILTVEVFFVKWRNNY